MPALQVRDFPVELYERLRIRAADEHRSIAQQTIVAVQEHLESGPMPAAGRFVAASASTYPLHAAAANSEAARQERIKQRQRFNALLDDIHSNRPKGFEAAQPIDPVQAVRELRDSR